MRLRVQASFVKENRMFHITMEPFSKGHGMNRLLNKVAVVTGSSSGIGKAIALRFAEEGAKVVVAARRKSLCEQTAKQICQKGGEAFVIQTDVSHENQVDLLFEKTVQQYGRVDIAVNNAGIFGGRRIAETTSKAFD